LVHEARSDAMQQVVENEKLRQRGLRVAKIEYYLRGCPLSGYGSYIVAEGERTGVNPYLCAAIATAESSNAWAEPSGSYNAWGMGPGMSFSSRQAAITFFFNNIKAKASWAPYQTGWDLQNNPRYCTTNPEEWAQNVTGIVDAIERIE